MTTKRAAGFVGFGYYVPDQIRTNSDPIFDRKTAGLTSRNISESDLFFGMRERRIASEAETSEFMMLRAGRMALVQAGLEPSRIDRLYGYASPSEYIVPNGLFRVHKELGLSSRAAVFPVQTDFSNFLIASSMAAEAVSSGVCDYAMVNCGGRWSRCVDYTMPHAWSVGDAAAAAVIGPSDHYRWLDHAVQVHSGDLHSMTLATRLRKDGSGANLPTFQIAETGIEVFMSAGLEVPPRLMRSLVERHSISTHNLALLTHQASRRLMDAWASRLEPREYPDTLAEYGNMTVATIGVNLARFHESINADYIGCIAVGVGQHFVAALIKK